MALEIGIGIGFGAILGATFFDNAPVGMSIGIAVGAACGWAFSKRLR
jgi:hypothetical protein